jgi:transglutaminase-like putative cysteine protease
VTRSRPVETTLAAIATLLACYPLTLLVTPDTWVRRALVCVIVVAGVGMIGRQLFRSSLAVLGLQLVVLTETVFLLHGRNHLWHGLPGLDAVLAFNNLLYDARMTVVAFAAPAPTNRGISLALSIIVALVALSVDYIAVTRRAPALAGLGLLTAYLITASNSGEALHWATFALPAVAWLVLLGRQGLMSMRRWSTVAPLPDPSDTNPTRDVGEGFATTARALGAGAIAVALLLPAITPHLPTRFLIDGLGRSSSGAGNQGRGEVRLSTTIDLSRSLRNPSSNPVLTYTTSDPSPPPLRVQVLNRFVNGNAVVSQGPAPDPQRDLEIPPPGGVDSSLITKDTTFTFKVTENKLAPPQIAAPAQALSADFGDAYWTIYPDGVISIRSRADDYSVTYVHPDPGRALLDGSTPTLADPEVQPVDLTLDPASEDRVRRMVSDVVPTGATELQAAVAIQDYLRGPDFTYSLDLAGPSRDSGGRLVQLDPISHFLVTKRGYCQQFATAMIMMARAEGIPARMAIGFLPGTVSNEERVVRASDAHAWPELYFEGAGWLRFEPTPAQRTGVAPGYTDLTRDSSGSSNPQIPGSPGTPTPNSQQRQLDNPALGADAAPGETPPPVSWERVRTLPRAAWVLLAAVVAMLVALTVPLAARLRRRGRARGADEAGRVEAQWQAMLARIEDLGVSPPTGSTPRQAGDYLRKAAYLGGQDVVALRRVVTTLELARYAAPGTPLDDISDDTGTVVRAIGDTRRRSDRIRAWWLPQDGVAAWQSAREVVLGAPRRWWGRVRG